VRLLGVGFRVFLGAPLVFLVVAFLLALPAAAETDVLARVRPKPPRALTGRPLEPPDRAGLEALRLVLALATFRTFAEGDFLPEVPDLPDLGATVFFLDDVFLPFAGFGFASALTKAVTALDATSIAASTFALAASPIASCAEELKTFLLSLSFSI